MLATRVAAAFVFTPVVFVLVWFGGWPLRVGLVILGLLMQWEFLRLTLPDAGRWFRATGYGLTLLACAATLGVLAPPVASLVAPAAAMAVLAVVMLRPDPIETSVRRAAMLALGVVYTGGLLPFLGRLRDLPHGGLAAALMALFCTWGADTGAYFSGRTFGRRKLYPKISPGKTVEGGLGGIAAAVGVAFLVRWLFDAQVPPVHLLLLGVVAGVIGTVGDLCESLLKRSVGAKDSSTLIPGHGGVLDRFDAVMFVAPAFYIYLALATRGAFAF